MYNNSVANAPHPRYIDTCDRLSMLLLYCHSQNRDVRGRGLDNVEHGLAISAEKLAPADMERVARLHHREVQVLH